MKPKELFERALRGDLGAAETCLTYIKRGSFSPNQVYQLLPSY